MDGLFIIVAIIAGFWLTKSFGLLGLALSTTALIAFGVWNHHRRQRRG
ncbi:MAG: hypothetical protein AB7O04_07000 [Hyphomonadaceae bacterium]